MANGIYVYWSCMRLTSHQCSTHTLHPCTLYGLALFIGAMGIFALIIHRLSRHSSFCENSPTFTEMHLVFSKAKFNFSFHTSVRNFSGWAGTFYRWPTYCLKGLVRERWREGERERWRERGGGRGRESGGGHRIAHKNKLRTRKCSSSMKSVDTIMFPKSCTKLDKIAELLLETFVNHWKNFLPE